MKKKLLLISSLLLNLALGTVLLIGFYRQPHENVVSNNSPVGFTTGNQDSLQPAIKDIQRFVRTFDNDANHRFVRAYTISSEDLLQVLGISDDKNIQIQYDSCRAYLGYDSDSLFKLYLTPVVNNQDVFLSFETGRRATSKPSQYSYVLDLIAPCPNTCDTLSPLYTGKMR